MAHSTATTTHAQVTPERIMQMAWGYAPPLILEAAIRHHVFDVLDSGPLNIWEVQKATGASARGLTAIMDALVGLNFLAKDEQGRFALTPESSAFLVSTKPGFQGGMIKHGSEQLIPRWLHLNEVVATGKPVSPVNQEASGGAFFHDFVLDIFPMSYPSAQALSVEMNYGSDGSPVRVLDLAAGSGVWGIAQAQSSARVQVTAVDWPEVIPLTKKTVERFGFADRWSYVEGDLHDADFGSGHHVATLGHILHSEGERRSRELLAKTFAALGSGGTIAIAEFLVNKERTGPVSGLFFAVNMIVNTQEGNTWSFEEIGAWLEEIGFRNVRSLPAPGPSPLILATKP
ncbi:MAG TPA: methyltransferase [Acidobacteriaceae bacterium]|jgi:precorrin-6B methylase 2|nr:methyltransferase [Acidobacteriaceae bacterium]